MFLVRWDCLGRHCMLQGNSMIQSLSVVLKMMLRLQVDWRCLLLQMIALLRIRRGKFPRRACMLLFLLRWEWCLIVGLY